ncbi:MAG: hypothetical protein AB7O64_18940 [Methylibium sp.]
MAFRNLMLDLRLIALGSVTAGLLLHFHETYLFAALPFPKRFLAPPLWWPCAPYVLVGILSCTRHRAAAAVFAVSALALDLVAHYLVYVRPYVPRRFDLPGLPVYVAPAVSLFGVGPAVALVFWLAARRANRRASN